MSIAKLYFLEKNPLVFHGKPPYVILILTSGGEKK